MIAWVALAPLLVAIVNDARRARPWTPHRPFLLGWTTGAVAFAGTLYWISTTIRTFGGLHPVVAVLVTVLLVIYLSIYPALFALVTSRVTATAGAGGLVLAPAFWVASEYGRGMLLSGFPWVLLGSSQATVLPVAQAASLVGVYGLSALVGVVNAGVAAALVPAGRWTTRWLPGAAAALLVVATVGWGASRLATGALTREGTPIQVGLVQGNVPQEEKWRPERASEILERYLDDTRRAAGSGATLVLWPESSTPFFLQEDPVGFEAVSRVVRETGVTLLLGSDQVEPGRPPRYYNAAFLLTPAGRVAAVYRKMHLVPFGEYVPFKRMLFFVGPLIESVSDFSPGTEPVMLPVDGRPVSTAICFESVFPGLTRQSVQAGSTLLTTITNDAWYGESSAPYQHFEQASLRAIEQGRYLLRAANTGISAIVDPYGRVEAQSLLFERAVLAGEARFLTTRTVYATIGDLIVQLSLVLTALALAVTWRRRRAGP